MARNPLASDPTSPSMRPGGGTLDEDGHLAPQSANDFVEGLLGDAERQRALEHLAGCDRCRELVAELGFDSTARTADAVNTVVGVPPPLDPLIGARLGEYEVLEKLSEGGMGAVYRGLQPQIQKPVAIKVLLPALASDAEHAHRLLAEARAVNAIRHPHIVDIFAFGTLPDGRHYFVMELLPGESLSARIGALGKLPVPEALSVLEQAMAALTAAHAQGVIHRDLKPSNIFVSKEAEDLHVTLLDFGVAKSVRAPIAGHTTLPGAIIGTPGFMAPEQISGGDITTAVDIYAMGAVAWILFTGTEVFQAESDIDLLRKHLNEPVPPIPSRAGAVPPQIESLIASMLAKKPADRPTAVQVRRQLSKLKRVFGRNAATTTVLLMELPSDLIDAPPTELMQDPKTENTQPPTIPPHVKSPRVAANMVTAQVTRVRRRTPLRWVGLAVAAVALAALLWFAAARAL